MNYLVADWSASKLEMHLRFSANDKKELGLKHIKSIPYIKLGKRKSGKTEKISKPMKCQILIAWRSWTAQI